MKIGSLCSGAGGLDLAVEQFFQAPLLWQSEIEPGACKVLAQRFPEVPNLGDLREVNWAAVDPVEILVAGFPCQPVSQIGKQQGVDDERWLWDDITAAISRMDPPPRLLVFENVPGLLTIDRGHVMARVVHSLAQMGYMGQYRTVRASDIGAPHRRERVFIVAHTGSQSAQRWGISGDLDDPSPTVEGEASQWKRGGNAVGDSCAVVADPTDLGCQRNGTPWGWGSGPEDGDRGSVADPYRPPRQPQRGSGQALPGREEVLQPGRCHSPSGRDWGKWEPAIRRWERILRRPAPEPLERTRLTAAFTEWMMGLPEGWVSDLLPRVPAVKVIGNGVCPQQALRALELICPAELVVN